MKKIICVFIAVLTLLISGCETEMTTPMTGGSTSNRIETSIVAVSTGAPVKQTTGNITISTVFPATVETTILPSQPTAPTLATQMMTAAPVTQPTIPCTTVIVQTQEPVPVPVPTTPPTTVPVATTVAVAPTTPTAHPTTYPSTTAIPATEPIATQPVYTQPISTTKADDSIVTADQVERIKMRFLELVNFERVKGGFQPLSLNDHLDAAAEVRSGEIIESFSHTRPNGSNFFTVIDETQYQYSTVGENICMTSHLGKGQYVSDIEWVGSDLQIESVAAWTFTLFKESPGHYENMMNSDYTDTGIGIGFTVDERLNLPYFFTAHLFGAT